MSGHNEIQEAATPAHATDNNALINCVDNARNQMSAKDYNACLQGGKDSALQLPGLELMDSKADVPPPPELGRANAASDKDLAADGIKRTRGKDDQGAEKTSTEFPNGVKVSTTGGSEKTMADGHKVTLGPSIMISSEKGLHEHPKGSGNYYDSHNKETFTANKDGSYTVYTDTGAYTAREDGTITKDAAIKNRDGSWTVIDTNDPLGGLPADEIGKIEGRPSRH